MAERRAAQAKYNDELIGPILSFSSEGHSMRPPPLEPPPGTVAGPDEARATHGPDDVDLTLIRCMLSLTPTERLEVLQASVRSILRMRGASTNP